MAPVRIKCSYSFYQHARDTAHIPLEHAEMSLCLALHQDATVRELWVLTAFCPGVLLPSEEKWL